MITAIERQTMKKVYLRLLPFCFILYFICYLDRVNVGFAALTMNKDLGLSSYVFGLGRRTARPISFAMVMRQSALCPSTSSRAPAGVLDQAPSPDRGRASS